MDKRIFLSTPISGFDSESEYTAFRNSLSQLIEELRKEYQIVSEIDTIEDRTGYDTPELSVEKDFCAIRNADIFLLIHPRRMQTSSFIELGYAVAYSKQIIIVSRQRDLPYLTLGLKAINHSFAIIDKSKIDSDTIDEIKRLIN